MAVFLFSPHVLPIISALFASIALIRATSIPSLPSGWEYVGCLYEGNGKRIINDTFYGVEAMTITLCVDYCVDQGLPYAAIEMGTQCFCGSSLTSVDPVSESYCDYTCGGDSSEPCGGYGYMTFFSKTADDPVDSAGSTTITSPSTSATTKATSSAKSSSSSTAAATTSAIATSTSVSSTSAASTVIQTTTMQTVIEVSGSSVTTIQTVSITNLSQFLAPTLTTSATSFTSESGGISSPASSSTSSSSQIPSLPSAASTSDLTSSREPTFRPAAQYVVFGKYASSAASIGPGSTLIHLAMFFSSLILLV